MPGGTSTTSSPGPGAIGVNESSANAMALELDRRRTRSTCSAPAYPAGTPPAPSRPPRAPQAVADAAGKSRPVGNRSKVAAESFESATYGLGCSFPQQRAWLAPVTGSPQEHFEGTAAASRPEISLPGMCGPRPADPRPSRMLGSGFRHSASPGPRTASGPHRPMSARRRDRSQVCIAALLGSRPGWPQAKVDRGTAQPRRGRNPRVAVLQERCGIGPTPADVPSRVALPAMRTSHDATPLGHSFTARTASPDLSDASAIVQTYGKRPSSRALMGIEFTSKRAEDRVYQRRSVCRLGGCKA
jgi:hypothetical protein